MSASVIVRLHSRAAFDEIHSILETLPDGLLMSDAMGRITYANARMEEMSGYARSELLGESVELLVPERLRKTHTRDRMRFSARPRTRSIGTALDTRLLRSDGTELLVQIQLSPAEIGGERGILAVIRDVLDSTEAEQLRRKHEDVLMLVVDREAIAMEVNAGVIHTLFGIGLHLQAGVTNATDQGARKTMEQAIADIDQAINEVREHIFRHNDIPF